MINIPYIHNDFRRIVDPYLKQVNDTPAVTAHLINSMLMGINKEKIDGVVNYIITKLVMNKEKIEKGIENFINILVKDMYIDNLDYYKINRFCGLIECILDNLEERNWVTEANTIFLVNLLVNYKYDYAKPYELRKMNENGDLI